MLLSSINLKTRSLSHKITPGVNHEFLQIAHEFLKGRFAYKNPELKPQGQAHEALRAGKMSCRNDELCFFSPKGFVCLAPGF